MAGDAARVESVALTDEDARWVDAQVFSGRYPNAAAVLVDAVRARRHEDEQEAALDAELGALVAEAAQEDTNGDHIDCHTPDDFDRAFGHLRTDAAAR